MWCEEILSELRAKAHPRIHIFIFFLLLLVHDAVKVLEGLLLERSYDKILYVGDGHGDFCACTRLGRHDLIYARKSYPGSLVAEGKPSVLGIVSFNWVSYD